MGVDDPILGQAVKAFIVLEKDVTMIDKQIIFECQQRL